MKKVHLVLFLAALTVSMVYAEDMKFGYIDSDRIIEEYNRVNDAKSELQQYSAAKEKKATQMQEEIRELQQKLQQQELMLSDEKKKQMLETLQQKTGEYQTFLQENFGQTGAVARKNNELMDPIMKDVNEAVKKIATDENYTFIFDNTVGLIYGKPAYDVTDKVLKVLNSGN
ncbi:MAG: OmpH family outer membrane protein [Fibrobacterota bacterium]